MKDQELKKLLFQAKLLSEKEMHVEVVRLFEEAISKHGESAILMINLHLAYSELSLDAMERAIDLDPNVKDTMQVYRSLVLTREEEDDLIRQLGGLFID